MCEHCKWNDNGYCKHPKHWWNTATNTDECQLWEDEQEGD